MRRIDVLMSVVGVTLAVSPSAARAFCGTYVGSAGETLTNRASQVVLVREGRRTTITMANDVLSAGPSFSMLIPVPGDVDPDDVTIEQLGPMERVDKYAAPRLVEYTCEDLHGDSDLASAGCSCAADAAKGLLSAYALEALPGFLESAGLADADLEVEVLSPSSAAELAGADALVGRSLSAEASALIDEALSAGASFISVKIDLRNAGAGALWLPPIQFSYASDSLSLPVRLGALNSAGSQDVILHVITDASQGQVGISNLPEVQVEAECMWRRDGLESFSGFYEDQATAAFDSAGGVGAYITEYVWQPTGCDPCNAVGPLDGEVMANLGFRGDPAQAALTRLHVRYTPDAGDLALYPSNTFTTQQLRFIQHDESLEQDFPVCGEGWVEGGGSCEDSQDTGSGGPFGMRLPAGWLLALGGLIGLGRRWRFAR
jgi:hypothetical protein